MGPAALLPSTAAGRIPRAQAVKPELPITPQTRTLPAEPCVNCHRDFFPLGLGATMVHVAATFAAPELSPRSALGSLHYNAA